MSEINPVPVTPEPTAPAVKSNRKRNIIIIAAVVLALCCAGSITALVKGVSAGVQAIDNPTSTATTKAPLKPADIPVDPEPTIPPPDTSAFGLALGESIEGSDGEGTWTITLSNPQLFTKACNPYADNPVGKYLVVDVSFEVTGGTADISEWDFKYFDANGRTYDGYGICEDTDLEMGDDLRAGSKRTGQVEFEVPNGIEGEIEYSPFARTIASWKVPAV